MKVNMVAVDKDGHVYRVYHALEKWRVGEPVSLAKTLEVPVEDIPDILADLKSEGWNKVIVTM